MINFRTLRPEDIEVRVAQCSEKGVQLLLYKTARCDMNILDETVGQENWDCEYASINGKLFCTVGIRCGDEGFHEWVYKQDVGSESDMEPVKGEASDAFKRACFKWGIGRELYTAPFIWVNAGILQRHIKKDNGKYACYDKFSVRDISVENGRITFIEIEDDNAHMTAYKTGMKTPEQKNDKFAKIRELKAKAISLGVNESGIEDWLAANIKKEKRDYSQSDISKTEKYLGSLIDNLGAYQK